MQELLALPAGTFGPLAIDSDSPNLQIVSRVYATTPGGTYGDAIEGVALDDPRTTGESGRILVVDGLEGTADGGPVPWGPHEPDPDGDRRRARSRSS